MENLGAVPGRSLICYDAGGQRQERHRRSGQRHLETKYGEFKIWALGKQRLQIEFSGVYEYKTPQGPTANEGVGSGVAALRAILLSSNPMARKKNAKSL